MTSQIEPDGQNQLREIYIDALEKMARDANHILANPWWRRGRSLRELSNHWRRLRGYGPLVYREIFTPGQYLPKAFLQDSDSLWQGESKNDFEIESQESFYYAKFPEISPVVRTIAFYLPQFHPIPENDTAWGRGFTEWSNVASASPLFDGHDQPRYPAHFGYYDLRVGQVLKDQATLAKNYGVEGFAYYFYWFQGRTLLETPLENMLRDPSIEMPFFLIWANENWTKRWDGQDQEIIVAQEHSVSDSVSFFQYISKYLRDSRYITNQGKPVLAIYRPSLIPRLEETVTKWRAMANELGLPGLHVIGGKVFGEESPSFLDGAFEFPPHGVQATELQALLAGQSKDFEGKIYDYGEVVANEMLKQRNPGTIQTVMLAWDNTPRKGRKGTVFRGFSEDLYQRWFSLALERAAKNRATPEDGRFVFINAWNEWAEGSYLEPDKRRGYGLLSTTRQTLTNYREGSEQFWKPDFPKVKSSKFAAIIHVHYEETIGHIRESLEQASLPLDLYFSTTSLSCAETLQKDFPSATVELFDNRGRDIRPFIETLRQILPLGYQGVLKIHGKRSTYRKDGDNLRTRLFESLLQGCDPSIFLSEPRVGLLVPDSFAVTHTPERNFANAQNIERLAKQLRFKQTSQFFPAGSMYWFRPVALARLVQVSPDWFGFEQSKIDGELSHAIERIIVDLCTSEGFKVRRI